MKWLEQQSDADPTTPQETVDTSPLKLLETTKINLETIKVQMSEMGECIDALTKLSN